MTDLRTENLGDLTYVRRTDAQRDGAWHIAERFMAETGIASTACGLSFRGERRTTRPQDSTCENCFRVASSRAEGPDGVTGTQESIMGNENRKPGDIDPPAPAPETEGQVDGPDQPDRDPSETPRPETVGDPVTPSGIVNPETSGKRDRSNADRS
jgi:hypothetical protein